MSTGQDARPAGADTERVALLVERLAATERELREILGGAADAVLPTRAGEQRFRALLESAADSITLFDAAGRVRYASPPTARLLHYDLETEFVGHQASEFVHPDDEAGFAAAMAASIERPGVRVPVTARLRRKDGVWRRYEGVLTNLLHDPAVRAVVSNGRDVTEREEMRAKLERHFELSVDLICTADADGCFRDVNPAFERVLGYTMEALRGQPFTRFVHPGDHESTVNAFAGVMEGRAIAGFTNRYRHKDGSYRVLQWNTVPDLEERLVYSVARDISERRRAEEALREAKDKYLAIFNQASQGIFQMTPAGDYVSANPAMARILGYDSPEQLIRERTQAAVRASPEWTERRKQFMRRLEQDDVVEDHEYEVTRRDGSTIWISQNARVVRAAGGKTLYYEGSVRDITARKLAAAALREREASLALAQHVAGFGSWELKRGSPDPAGDRSLSWSEQTCRIFGLTPGRAQVTEETFFERVHPEDRSRVAAAFEAALRAGSHYTVEHRIVRPDGEVRTVREDGEVFRGEHDGQWVNVAGVVQDITQSKIAEEERERLAVIVECSGDAILSTDLAGTITSWNAAAGRIYGYAPAEMIGQAITRLFKREDDPAERAVSARVASTRQVVRYEADRVCKDGGIVQVAVTLSPVLDPAGRVVALARIVRDITERKEAEAALEAAQRQLVEASRQAGKAEVATNVLHNVGNVLNSMNISAELIAGPFQSPAVEKLERLGALLAGHAHDLPAYLSRDAQGTQVVGYLALLVQSLRQDHDSAHAEMVSLRRNIDHIRQIIAVQQDQSRHDTWESVAAADVFADALRINAAAMERHHVQVIHEYQPDLTLVTDKHRVLQILVNLIRNAKHAFAPMPIADRRLTLRLEQGAGGAVRFWVRDNGMGIAPEHLGRLFEHGFTTRPEGHGFGLHSAALLARELGGSLQASSDGPGRGAAFLLEIPLTPPSRQ